MPCAWAAALLFWGATPRFPFRGPAAGRTMLLKEYRICMPLTVDEVSAAPGLARSGPSAPCSGVRVPCRRLPAGESTAGGREIWEHYYLQNLKAGGE